MKRSYIPKVDSLEDRCVPSVDPVTTTISSVIGTTSTIIIVNPSTTVTLDAPGDQTNLVGDTVSVPMSASISDGSAPTFSASGLPDGLSIDPDSGIISGTVAADASSSTPYAVTVTATGAAAGVSASQSFNWTVNSISVTVSGPGDQTNTVGDSVSLAVSAWSTDGAALTYSATGLPSGLSIDPNSGIISGTVAAGAAQNAVTVTATDSAANANSTTTFNWTVQTPLVIIASPGDQTTAVGQTGSASFAAAATSGAAVTYTATGLPDGLTIDPNTGTVSGTVADDAVGGTVTITATDTSNNVQGTLTINWTVNPAGTAAAPVQPAADAGYFFVIDIPLVDPYAVPVAPAPTPPTSNPGDPWAIYGWDSIPLMPPISAPIWF